MRKSPSDLSQTAQASHLWKQDADPFERQQWQELSVLGQKKAEGGRPPWSVWCIMGSEMKEEQLHCGLLWSRLYLCCSGEGSATARVWYRPATALDLHWYMYYCIPPPHTPPHTPTCNMRSLTVFGQQLTACIYTMLRLCSQKWQTSPYGTV